MFQVLAKRVQNTLGVCVDSIDLVPMIIDNGSTVGFALLVWWELRSFKTLVEQKIDGAIQLLNRIDERTKQQ